MLVKWVRCEVADRVGFDAGQEAWAGLRGLPGFLGQRGGWSANSDTAEAHVLAFWADQESYDAFMTGPHDTLAAAQQSGIRALDAPLLFHYGQDVGLNLVDAPGTGFLRLAYCRAKSDRVEHFIEAQNDVWNPAMSQSPGFLGGTFARRGEREFLVVTQWASAPAHARYRSERFPELRERAEPSGDLDAITGHLVGLEPHWSVAPVLR